MHKRYVKSSYENYVTDNINSDEFNKILVDYISIQNKKFSRYFIRCEFVVEFDIKFITKRESNYFYNTGDIGNIKNYLLYWID